MRKILFKSKHDYRRTMVLFVMAAVVVLFLQGCFCPGGSIGSRSVNYKNHSTAGKIKHEAMLQEASFGSNSKTANQ